MKTLTLGLAVLTTALLAGCSSTAEKERHLELLAGNRASLISAELPLEYGPLSIMRANSKGSTIEIMMIYNTDDRNAKPIDQVMQSSMRSYCTNKDTRDNLDAGLSYRIKMRNARGKLMVDQLVNKETCAQYK